MDFHLRLLWFKVKFNRKHSGIGLDPFWTCWTYWYFYLVTQLISYSKTQNQAPFQYKPYLLSSLPPHSVNYICEQKNDEKTEYAPQKRIVIVKNSFVKSEDELKAYAYLLFQYLVRLDEYRTIVDHKEVEEVIINDFIKLDSFIHKIWSFWILFFSLKKNNRYLLHLIRK